MAAAVEKTLTTLAKRTRLNPCNTDKEKNSDRDTNQPPPFKRCYFTSTAIHAANPPHVDIRTKMAAEAEVQLQAPIALKSHDESRHEMMAIIDSASDISALSTTVVERLGLTNHITAIPATAIQHLQAVNGSLIQRIGLVETEIRCGRYTQRHTFDVIESSDLAIIGIDLMPRLGMYIANVPTDFPAREGEQTEKTEAQQMEDSLRERPAPWTAYDGPTADEQATIDEIIQALIDDNTQLSGENACADHEERFLDLQLKPEPPDQPHKKWVSQYPLARFLDQLDKQVEDWQEANVVEEITVGEYNSPMIAVCTRDEHGSIKKVRICLDFRHINDIIIKNHDRQKIIPKIAQILRRIEGFKHASCIDLKSAYNQLCIREADRPLTAFTYKRRRFQFKRWPFGLHPATGQFQALMEKILAGLDYVAIYIDDIMIFSDGSIEDHAQKCAEVLRRLNKAGLKLNPQKCHWGYKRVLLLGHFVGRGQRGIDPRKVTEALALPIPTTGKQMQAALGFFNFVRPYVPSYACITQPLDQLRHVKKFKMNEHEREAFDTLVKAVANCPTLSDPDPDLPFHLATDASQYGLGAALYQETPEGERRYIAFASKSLKGAQKNYPATKRELLGIVYALREFHPYLYAKKFNLFTDHKALVAIKHKEEPAFCIKDWLHVLNEYEFDLHHRPGLEMILPDALSRVHYELKDSRTRAMSSAERKKELNVFCTRIQYENREHHDLPTSSILDEAASKINKTALRMWRTRRQRKATQIQVEQTDRQLEEGVQMREAPILSETTIRKFTDHYDTIDVITKKSQQQELIRSYHARAHMGSTKLFLALWNDNYWWPNMKKDCMDTIARCKPCLAYNTFRHGFYPVKSLKADKPNDHWAIDLATNVPTAEGGWMHILVVRDVASRYLWAVAIKDKEAKTIAAELSKLIQAYGAPKVIQSDNGLEFVNTTVKELLAKLNVDFRQTCPYNPRANGLAEASVKYTKQCLKKKVDGNYHHWNQVLQGIVLTINTTTSKYLNATPYSIYFGRPCNKFADYSKIEVPPPPSMKSLAKLKQQQDEFTNIVLPQIQLAAYSRQQRKNELLDENRKIVQPLEVGDMVMVIDTARESSWEPAFLGPYTITKVGRNKTYKLKDPTGRIRDRPYPISQIQPITSALPLTDSKGEVIAAQDTDKHYVVKEILDHRVLADGEEEFLTLWKGLPAEEASWEPQASFDNASTLVDYFRNRTKRQRKRDNRTQALIDSKQARSEIGKMAIDCTTLEAGELIAVRDSPDDTEYWLARIRLIKDKNNTQNQEAQEREMKVAYLMPLKAASLSRMIFKQAFIVDNYIDLTRNGIENGTRWTGMMDVDPELVVARDLHLSAAGTITKESRKKLQALRMVPATKVE